MDNSVKNTIYYALLLACVATFSVFTYLAYSMHNLVKGTGYTFLSYIMVLPVVVSIILFIIILAIGKDSIYQEIMTLFQ